MSRLLYILSILLVLASCGVKKTHNVVSMQGEYIAVGKTNHPDEALTKLVNGYKVELDKEMNKVIGYSAHDMSTGRPESMLTNLTSDFMLELDGKHTQGKTIDIALMNVNGIRAPIAQGEITIGDIFDAFPFDNALYVVELKGKYLIDIFESYAKLGGAGVSKNVRATIKDKELIGVTVNGEPVDESKVYTIITLDYLAEGNDGMEAMKNAEWSAETGIKLRDYMLEKIKETEAKGEKLWAALDGRITILE